MLQLVTAPFDRARMKRCVPPEVVPRFEKFASLIGLPTICVEAESMRIVAAWPASTLKFLPEHIAASLTDLERCELFPANGGLQFAAAPLAASKDGRFVAVAVCLARPDARPADLTLSAAEQGWTQDQLNEWIENLPSCSPEIARNLLELAYQQLDQSEHERDLLKNIEELDEQIEYTYEEISLLHGVTRNLQISRSPRDVARLVIERLQLLVGGAGTSVCFQNQTGARYYLEEGETGLTERQFVKLMERFEDHDWSRPLVKNHVEQTPVGAAFPKLRNFVVVPIADGPYRSGWIFTCNLPGEREFGTVEASLLSSIATILGTHVRNIDLYQQHEDLLLSFVGSLVNTLDAKDPYTRGHSERVALAARRLATEMGLPPEEVHDVFVSAMLHDIGKIGVDDRILQKPGKLTDEEFDAIKEHPMIGYNILLGLKNLQRVLPGVRNHHEAWDGSGYPDGLKGEQIPLMARILAVADAYDAMGSDRPYRKGMPLEKLESIFRQGSGRQWDPTVIAAYFAVRDDVRQLATSYIPGERNLLEGTHIRRS